MLERSKMTMTSNVFSVDMFLNPVAFTNLTVL